MSNSNEPLEITIVENINDFVNFPEDYSNKILLISGELSEISRKTNYIKVILYRGSEGFYVNLIMSKALTKFLLPKKGNINIILYKKKLDYGGYYVAIAAFTKNEYLIDFSFSKKEKSFFGKDLNDFLKLEKEILEFLDNYREDIETWIQSKTNGSKNYDDGKQKETRAKEIIKKEELRAQKISDIVAKEQTKDGPNRYKVKVLRIVHYGAVVDLGNGLEGVIPITDSKWPSKLKPGDELDTEIYEMDITLKIV